MRTLRSVWSAVTSSRRLDPAQQDRFDRRRIVLATSYDDLMFQEAHQTFSLFVVSKHNHRPDLRPPPNLGWQSDPIDDTAAPTEAGGRRW
ncbi:MAG: hypothetical protein M1815_000300 [Lichina confinis]|nr:MAG: hypothetical protein M1815_000300 [Lichina confinis]